MTSQPPTTDHRPQAPSITAHRVLEAGLWALPDGPVRQRYRQELLAELYLVPRRRQGWVALRMAVRMRTLRDALVGEGAPVDGGRRSHSLRCRVGLHRYHLVSNPDGDRYQCCARCGKMYPGGGRGGPAGLWGAANPGGTY